MAGVLLIVLASSGASDTGHRDAGESASAWHVGGFLFWMVLVVVVLAVLVGGLVLATRGGGDEA